MKLYNIIMEETATPVDKKMVSVLRRMKVDPNEVGEIWNKLKDPLEIKNMELKIKIAFLYTEACYYDDDGEVVCHDLDDVNWDNLTDTRIIPYDQLALSEFLNIPPFLLGEKKHSYYGLNMYEFDGDEYAVGDDTEVEVAMYKYSENMIEYELDTMEEWWINDYLSPNEWAINQFCEEEADNRLENMDEEGMMQEAGLDPEEKQDEIDTWETEKEEKEEELVDMEDELNELDEQRDEIEEDYGDKSDEYNEIDEEYGNKEYGRDNLTDDIETLQSDIETTQQELDGMPEEAKDQLRESYIEDYKDAVRDEGIGYFTNNFGMSREDAINYYFDFNKEGAIQSLAGGQDRGDILSSYDGREHEEEYDDVSYYIYQV